MHPQPGWSHRVRANARPEDRLREIRSVRRRARPTRIALRSMRATRIWPLLLPVGRPFARVLAATRRPGPRNKRFEVLMTGPGTVEIAPGRADGPYLPLSYNLNTYHKRCQ